MIGGIAEIEMLLLFLFWIGEAVVIAAIVNGRGGVWIVAFIITLFFGPLGFLISLGMGPVCGECGKKIPDHGKVCPYCRHRFAERTEPIVKASNPEVARHI